jgi:predicted dehydrogenase
VKKIILIIGYGSIGKRHAKILKKFNNVKKIYVYTKQKIEGLSKLQNLNQIKKINPDYIIISSKTSEHYKHLNFIEKKLSKKTILVEKPLFNNYKKLKIKNNKVIVGYNLRFHPIIHFLKKYIERKKIYSVNISCESYLPKWRKNIVYSNSNSAKKKYGGGVLLELSHELDYLQWIFSNVKKINYAIVKKISNLKIDTEDFAVIGGRTKITNFHVSLNFFSLHAQRKILVNGNNFSLEADLIKNTIKIIENNRKKIKKFKINNNYTYIQQHRLLLNNDFKNACTYSEGIKLIKLIKKIKN